MLAVAALLLAACGGGGDESATDDTQPAGDENVSPEEQELIDAATEEGSVVLYSSQLPANLEAFAQGFEEEYPGIDVEAIRMLDTEIGPKVEAEAQNGLADMVVTGSLPLAIDLSGKDLFVPPTAAGFDADYEALGYLNEGGYFEVGSALLVPTWNTGLVPDGIDDFEDLLDPELADGRIGLPEPSAASFVDMYVYLEEEYGTGFLEDLGAQNPRMYASAAATGQAVLSGEISVAPFAPPPDADIEMGAPVDYWVPDSLWGARYYGSVLAAAPHPAAAQLLAEYMITPEGQELVQKGFASIYPDIPGTLASNDEVRRQDIELLTPEFVAEFATRWEGLRGG
jgi:iron(III) transport system substrate-binding protein